MPEILKEWLTERLRRPITWESEAFGDMMKNGFVVAGVLLSYRVINGEEYFVIRSGYVPEDVKNNWKYISGWLERLDIHLNDIDVENIIDGRASSLLRLFYRLFLHLDKRDRTNFIKHERKLVSDLVEKVGHRFKVEKVVEKEESFVDDLSKPLLNEKHFIEWQQKKVKQVKETYDYIRHKYSKIIKRNKEKITLLNVIPTQAPKLTDKEQKDMKKFAIRHPCKFENYTYEELLSLEKKALEQRTSISGSDWAAGYMDNLHSRLQKKTDSEEFQKRIRNTISTSLWDISIAEEETQLDIELAKKVMKLSQFEKQMCTQIMETKQQARNLFHNRAQAEKEFTEQREQQFNQFLDSIKEQIHLEEEEIDFEKRRQQILHKKLYAEKMKRKRQHYYEICYDTMLSIVDYATKYAYFKLLIGDEIPEHFIHEWKILYYKQQPIFDILDPMEDILKEVGAEEEQEPEVEEIVRLELDRQEALNDEEFKEYHNYSYPWTLDLLIPNFNPEAEERKYEYLGSRILGHVVFTLLDIKYPYPPLRPPADLPDYKSKALLRGLPDRAITIPMQILLNSRKIHVVRLESAINFCLRRFKNELVGCTDIELSFDKFTSIAQEEDDRELIKLMKIDDENTNKSTQMAISAMLGVIPANTKQTQTPKTIPEEEIVLSNAADLGRYTYESLNAGDTLTDHLLSAMIVEYLKDQDDIVGFVLINYPNTYREAQILEETFLGIPPPDDDDLDDRDDIYLEESIVKHRKLQKDQYKEIRVSRLVNNPHKNIIEKPFESYFTCYINLKATDDILQEFFIWDLNVDNSELIDRFYAAMGLNYSMYYEGIDKELLAQICKYIIGDFHMPLKSSSTLFGENVLSLLDFPSLNDKTGKSKIIKPEISNGKSQNKLRQGSKTSKASLSNEIVETVKEASTEDYPDEPVVVTEEKSIGSLEEIKLLAGEEEWDYGEIPISELIGVALATCWEAVEKIYIHDMTQLFFAKRLQMNCLVPYTRYIKDKMEQIITLPSHKQDIVSRFQKEYNDFESDWRDINLAKNEWHCRVKELQKQLYQICDERKLHAMRQRHLLICDNWAMEELLSMANTYISCMQAELNRSIMSFQALYDFYYAMIKRTPAHDRLSPKELVKISRDSEETSGSKRGGGEDKVYKQLKAAFQDLQLKNIEIDYTNNPFNLVIENNAKLAMKIIKETNDSFRNIIAREYSEIAKIQPPIKKKDDSTSLESINIEEVFKTNALKCIEEWTMGINGEMFGSNLRILALQYKCYRDMKLFNDQIYSAFREILNDINTYYQNEIESVDRLCKYVQMAVENGRRIPESLKLENDTFIIDPNLLQFAPPEPAVDTGEITEAAGEFDFKISQLARLRSQFKIVAPTGIILQQAFIYILQDFIFFGKETCEGALFPEGWKSIDPKQVNKFVYHLYGDTVYVDWRDFLIHCLNIRFPDVEELLEARKNLRCKDLSSRELIRRDDFIEEELWYEADFDPECRYAMLRKNLMKHFLFELFETEENMMNYSALLLAFCKNVDPIEGFATALSMAVGKKTCHNLNECEAVICKLIEDKEYKDACLACALKCSGQFLNVLLDNVVNYCEGITISEVKYIPSEEKKGKKGKGGPKSQASSKRIETTQSARNAKPGKTGPSRSKTTQSAVNVKSTFICPPCDDEEEKEEKVEEKIVVEEEVSKPEIEPDPSLVYAISQSVIWNVLRTCLPWHFVLVPEERMTPYTNQVTELLKRLEGDTDTGDIYVAKFVSDPKICLLLNKVKKFNVLNLAEEIRKVFV